MAQSPRGERRGIQIGPRIRVGGTLGKIGNKIKEYAPFIGAAGAGLPGVIQGEVIKNGADPAKVGQGFVNDLKTGAKNIPLAVGIQAATGGGTPSVPGIPGLTGNGAGGGFDLGSLLDAGLGTAGLVNAAQLAGKSDKFANTAYGDVRSSYDARAPLRSAGISGMLNPGAGVPLKLAGVQANTGVGNPFSRKPSPGVAL